MKNSKHKIQDVGTISVTEKQQIQSYIGGARTMQFCLNLNRFSSLFQKY